MKMKRKIRRNKGITLIALVITIIVLLILAAVSISMLTGENGILRKAQTASQKATEAEAKEKVQVAVMGSYGKDGNLDYKELKTNLDRVERIDKDTVPPSITEDSFELKVVVDGYNIIIKKNGEVSVEGESTGGDSEEEDKPIVPSTADTIPFLPEGAIIDEEHSTLENGLVIKDENNNEWVWIEVPKSIYSNTSYNGGTAPSSSEDYEKIESVMQAYARAYRGSYTDTFYATDQHGFANSTEYNNWKNSMLKSVYENGGFYIGRYEVGTETARVSSSDTLTTPLIQRDKYPYNFVTSSQAQTLAKQLTTGEKKSSLMFGIQWDLIMKFIEVKGVKTQAELKEDSTSWGNYKNATFTVNRGEYTTKADTKDSWNVASNYTKPSANVLLTTGATERNNVLGIYDLAGNVWEWTLEKTTESDNPCADRGGNFYSSGSNFPAVYHNFNSSSQSNYNHGFRPALW